MTIILENVTTDTLLQWMAEPVDVDEDEYQDWKAKELSKIKSPLQQLTDGVKPRTYVRGSDFRSYLSCARILYWNVHKPRIQRNRYINKGIFGAIKKHELIQERLEEKGWYGEFEPTMDLPEYGLSGIGHVDVLSPSGTFFVEIKHNKPSEADELQCAWYQYSLPGRPTIVILYRNRVVIIPNHTRFIQKYIPRVCGVIKHPEILPPKHPNFPKCRGTCDYADRCGRKKRVPMHNGTPDEWINYFKAIGAWKPR